MLISHIRKHIQASKFIASICLSVCLTACGMIQLKAVPVQISLPNVTTHLTLKYYIEGYYAGGNRMNPAKFNLGLTGVTTTVDDIVIELKHYSSLETIASVDATLTQDGNVDVYITHPIGQYYLAIKHKNTLQTWSAISVPFTGSNIHYDFSTAAASAYGSKQVQVEAGVYAFYSGDVDQDGSITATDKGLINTDIGNGNTQASTDLNGDGTTDAADKALCTTNIGLSADWP